MPGLHLDRQPVDPGHGLIIPVGVFARYTRGLGARWPEPIGILLLLVKAVGVGPVHCDMILIVEPGIGLTTPPVGSVLFGGSAVGKLPIEKAVLALLPFFVLLLIVPMLVTCVPQLSPWLRRAVGV